MSLTHYSFAAGASGASRVAVAAMASPAAGRGRLSCSLGFLSGGGFIIEEGFPIAMLRRVASSMGASAQAASVAIVAGDTKVVGRGAADKLFINTAGIGVIPKGVEIRADKARPGDLVLVSGPLG